MMWSTWGYGARRPSSTRDGGRRVLLQSERWWMGDMGGAWDGWTWASPHPHAPPPALAVQKNNGICFCCGLSARQINVAIFFFWNCTSLWNVNATGIFDRAADAVHIDPIRIVYPCVCDYSISQKAGKTYDKSQLRQYWLFFRVPHPQRFFTWSRQGFFTHWCKVSCMQMEVPCAARPLARQTREEDNIPQQQ